MKRDKQTFLKQKNINKKKDTSGQALVEKCTQSYSVCGKISFSSTKN